MWLLLFVVACGAISTFGDFQELRKAARSSEDGRAHSQDFYHEDKIGYVALRYEVLHQERHFLHLDSNDSVTAVSCENLFDQGFLMVIVNANAASYFSELSDLVITGSLSFGCKDKEEPKEILRKLIKKPVLIEASGLVASFLMFVEPASMLDVYEEATIEFRANKFQEQQQVKSNNIKEKHRRLLSWDRSGNTTVQPAGFFDSLSAAWAAVKNLGNVVSNIVDGMKIVVDVLSGGDYSYDQSILTNTFLWNVDASGKIINPETQVDSDISCHNCGVKCTLDVTFSLSIRNKALESVRLVAGGSLAANLGVNAKISRTWTKENSTLIGTINIPPVYFWVGPIKFNVRAVIPILLGYSLTAEVRAQAKAEAKFGGAFAYGFVYTRSTGFGLIHQQNFTYQGQLLGIGSASVVGSVYVLPTVQLIVSYIGGPNVGIKGYCEVGVEYTTDVTDPCDPAPGKFTTNLGLEITIGAKVDVNLGGISLYKKDWTPVAVYSAKYPIVTACLSLLEPVTDGLWREHEDAQRRFAYVTMPDTTWDAYVPPLVMLWNASDAWAVQAVDLGCAAGNTWTGSVQRSTGTDPICKSYPAYRKISMQAVDAVNDGIYLHLTLAVTNNDAILNEQPYACVFQRTYETLWHWLPGTVSFQRVASNLDYTKCSGVASGSNCTCTNTNTMLPDSFSGSFTDNLDFVSLRDSRSCTRVTLNRVTAGTTGVTYRKSRDHKMAPVMGCQGA